MRPRERGSLQDPRVGKLSKSIRVVVLTPTSSKFPRALEDECKAFRYALEVALSRPTCRPKVGIGRDFGQACCIHVSGNLIVRRSQSAPNIPYASLVTSAHFDTDAGPRQCIAYTKFLLSPQGWEKMRIDQKP